MMLLRDPWNERSPVSQRSGRVCEGSWPRTWWGVTAGGNEATTLGEVASWRTIANREPAGSRKIQEIPWNITLHFINFRSFQDVPSKLELDSAGCSMPQGMCTPQNMCVIFIRVSGMGLFVWTIGSPWIYWLLITYIITIQHPYCHFRGITGDYHRVRGRCRQSNIRASHKVEGPPTCLGYPPRGPNLGTVKNWLSSVSPMNSFNHIHLSSEVGQPKPPLSTQNCS